MIQRLVPSLIYLNDNPQAPAEHKYIGLVHDFNPKRIQFFISTSPDGLVWTRQQKPFHEVPAGDDGHVVYWDSNLGKYVAYLRIWHIPKTGEKGGWSIRDRGGLRWVEQFVSADLTNWSEPELLKFRDASGRDAPAGRRLVLNYETAAAGSIRVEIQDPAGVPIPGYGLADCPDRFGDEIEGVMQWKTGPDLGPLVGKPVRLRFVLKDADLYSMRFANPGNRQYRVTYDANGATSGATPSAQTKEHDVGLTLALSGRGLGEATFLKKTGFVFAGWNTAADGSGTTYAPGDTFTSKAAVTLYAQWKRAGGDPGQSHLLRAAQVLR